MDEIIGRALHQIVVAEHAGDLARPAALARLASRGELVRLVRGIYAPPRALEGLRDWEVDEVTARAASLHGRVRQPLCRRSAARVWGVPLLGPGESRIDVLAWDARAGRHSGDVRYWSTSDDATHVVEHEGVTLTDLPRTLAELALTESFATAVAAVDWGIRVRGRDSQPRTTIDQIAAVADELGLVRGRARLRRVLSFADGRAESPGESWSRVLIDQLGFEPPELQHEYVGRDGRVFRADFRWGSARLAGEFDGLKKYKAAELRGGRSAEQVVVDEKLREDDIRATGDSVSRWGWSELRAAQRFAAQLLRAGVPRRRAARPARFRATRTR